MESVEIGEATGTTDFFAGKLLIAEYAANLGIDLGFQNFAEELESLTEIYTPPDGCLLIARTADKLIGCVAVRRHDSTTCEMKRLYVKRKYQKYQGRGTGKQLAETAIKCARLSGYTHMVLDTLSSMTAAHALYKVSRVQRDRQLLPKPFGWRSISGTRYKVV